MPELNEILAMAEELGFSHTGTLAMDALIFRPEVREMCAADKCGHYGRTWTCPPGCGSLDAIAEKAAQYTCGVIVQSTGELEDAFDAETMMETGRLQGERFDKLIGRVREQEPDCLPMSAGGCTRCAACTYPDAPCRFPHLATTSMEAYGLVVSEVCKASGIPYYYGPNTITYTSCILLK